MNKTFKVKLWDETHTLTLIDSTLAAFTAYVDGDTCSISVSIAPNTGMAACMIKPVAPSDMGEKQP